MQSFAVKEPRRTIQFQFVHPPPAQPKRDHAEQAEGAINQPPVKWNPSNCPEDQRVRNNQRTGDHAEAKEPAIANWITQRASERNGNDKMSEGKPVRSVGHKRILGASLVQGFADGENP